MRGASLLYCGLLMAIGARNACADAPTVSATGRHVEYLAPETIRVRCRIFAEGKTAASATGKLQANRKAIEARIAKLKEAPRSHISEPLQMQEKPTEGMAARMQVMMMGGDKKKSKEPELIRLTTTIDLEWPMKATDTAAMHERADEIRSAVASLRLSDSDESSDDEDAKEDSDEKKKAGEHETPIRVEIAPTLFYVKSLSREDIDKATAAAFKDAKMQAERLAKASGRSLGELRSVADGAAALPATGDLSSQQEAAMEAMFGGRNKVKFGDEADQSGNELLGQDLRPLRHEVKVQATFAIAGP